MSTRLAKKHVNDEPQSVMFQLPRSNLLKVELFKAAVEPGKVAADPRKKAAESKSRHLARRCRNEPGVDPAKDEPDEIGTESVFSSCSSQ